MKSKEFCKLVGKREKIDSDINAKLGSVSREIHESSMAILRKIHEMPE